MILKTYSGSKRGFLYFIIGALTGGIQFIFRDLIFAEIIFIGKVIFYAGFFFSFVMEFILIRFYRVRRGFLLHFLFLFLRTRFFQGGILFYLLLNPLLKREDWFLQQTHHKDLLGGQFLKKPL